jgi:hypothetical protein
VSVLKVEPPIDYGDGPWTVADDFGVASGDTTFVSLVQYGEARDPQKYPCGDSFFELLPATTGSPKFDVGKEYVLTLRAMSPRSAYQDFQCKVWVENGRLRIENVTPPALTPREAINELGRLRSKETELRNERVKSDAQFADWKGRITKLRDDVERNVAVCSLADAHRFKTVGNLRHTVPAGEAYTSPLLDRGGTDAERGPYGLEFRAASEGRGAAGGQHQQRHREAARPVRKEPREQRKRRRPEVGGGTGRVRQALPSRLAA